MKKQISLIGRNFFWHTKTIGLLCGLLVLIISSWGGREILLPHLYDGHDVGSHITRQIGFEQALKDGQFPPRWSNHFFRGIGSPVLMLNYQLPYFITEVWRWFGLSFFDSFKMTLLVTYLMSGLIAYWVLSRLFGRWAGTVGAILYVVAPYRFVDLYVRASLGEAISFMFPPLILYGLVKNKKVVATLAWAGLFLTHPVASAMFSALFLGYVMLLSWLEQKWVYVKTFVVTFLVALLLAGFNLVPTLLLTKQTHYTPIDSQPLAHLPTWQQLLNGPWGYGWSTQDDQDKMSFQIGWAGWTALVISSGWLLLKLGLDLRKKKMPLHRQLAGYVLFVTLAAVFIMLPISVPFWQIFKLTKIVDFPWRILMLTIFGTAYLSSWLVTELNQLPGFKVKSLWSVLVGLLLIVIAITNNWNFRHRGQPLSRTEQYFIEAGDTGDFWGEYAAKWRVSRWTPRFDYLVEPKSGLAEITRVEDHAASRMAQVNATTDVDIRFNIMYFPGWKVKIDDQIFDPTANTPCFITTLTPGSLQDDSGLIQCRIKAGLHQLIAFYTVPQELLIGNTISVMGIGVILWWMFQSFYPHIMKKNRLLNF